MHDVGPQNRDPLHNLPSARARAQPWLDIGGRSDEIVVYAIERKSLLTRASLYDRHPRSGAGGRLSHIDNRRPVVQ
jgi:hypothetical protein